MLAEEINKFDFFPKNNICYLTISSSNLTTLAPCSILSDSKYLKESTLRVVFDFPLIIYKKTLRKKHEDNV